MITEEEGEVGIYTETLARLYWRQGFLSKALHIYRHLIELHPQQANLQSQIHELEEQIRNNAQSSPLTSRASSPPSAPHTPSMAPAAPIRSQTTRRVLTQLEKWLQHLQQHTERR